MSGVYRFKYVYYGDKRPDEVVVDGVTCRREGISEVVKVNVGNVHVKVNDDGGGVKVGGFAWYVYIVLCLGGAVLRRGLRRHRIDRRPSNAVTNCR